MHFEVVGECFLGSKSALYAEFANASAQTPED